MKAGIKKYHDIIANNMAGVARIALATSGETEKAQRGVKYVIDTDVENFLHVGLIHLLFPTAIIINIMRTEPLDVLLNIYQQRGTYSDGKGGASCFGYTGQGRSWSLDFKHLAQYYLSYLDITAHWRSTLSSTRGTPGNSLFFDIAYEHLLHPLTAAEELQPILSALGLEYESAMSLVGLNKTKEVKKVLDPSGSWKHYQSHLEPLVELLKEPLVSRRANGTLPLAEYINFSLLS
jgi:hypothetical protein